MLANKPPVWKERQIEVRQKRAFKRALKEQGKSEWRERREELTRIEEDRVMQRETYQGWGWRV